MMRVLDFQRAIACSIQNDFLKQVVGKLALPNIVATWLGRPLL
jgi:hypothetical protein